MLVVAPARLFVCLKKVNRIHAVHAPVVYVRVVVAIVVVVVVVGVVPVWAFVSISNEQPTRHRAFKLAICDVRTTGSYWFYARVDPTHAKRPITLQIKNQPDVSHRMETALLLLL